MINCEIYFILKLSENCVLTNLMTNAAIPAQGYVPAREAINAPTSSIFKIADTKWYVIVVDNKLLDQLKTGSKRTIKWSKYRLIDSIFTKVNRLFVLPFKSKGDLASFSSIILFHLFQVLYSRSWNKLLQCINW